MPTLQTLRLDGKVGDITVAEFYVKIICIKGGVNQKYKQLLKNDYLRSNLSIETLKWLNNVVYTDKMINAARHETFLRQLSVKTSSQWVEGVNLRMEKLMRSKLPMQLFDSGGLLPVCFERAVTMMLHITADDSQVRSIRKYLRSVCAHETRSKTAKAIKYKSALLKVSQDEIDVNWACLVDWDLFLGYNSMADVEDNEIVEDIKKWCEGNIDMLRDEEYYSRYESAVEEVLTALDWKKVKWMNEEQYCGDFRNFITVGSSAGVKGMVSVEAGGKRYDMPSAPKKPVYATIYSLEQMGEMLMKNDGPTEFKVSVKVELGARNRVIVLSDWIMNAQMNLILKAITQAGKRWKFSDMYVTPEEKLNRMKKRSEHIEDSVNVPIDSAEFDHFVTRREIVVVQNAIAKVIMKELGDRGDQRDFYLRVWNNCWLSYWKSSVSYQGKKVCEVGHGVLSGIKLTAVLDTIVNTSRQVVVKNMMSTDKVYEKADRRCPATELVSGFGDDADNKFNNWYSAVQVLVMYERLNFKPHPNKNFVSGKRTEWLRRVIDKTSCMGYVARIIPKVLYRQPEGSPELHSIQATRAWIQQVADMYARVVQPKIDWEWISKEIAWRFKISPMVAIKLMRTPISLGGLGVNPSMATLSSVDNDWSVQIGTSMFSPLSGAGHELPASQEPWQSCRRGVGEWDVQIGTSMYRVSSVGEKAKITAFFRVGSAVDQVVREAQSVATNIGCEFNHNMMSDVMAERLGNSIKPRDADNVIGQGTRVAVEEFSPPRNILEEFITLDQLSSSSTKAAKAWRSNIEQKDVEELVVSTVLQGNDLAKMREITARELLPTFDFNFKVMTAGLFRQWVKGKVEARTPIVLGVSGEAVAIHSRAVFRELWAAMIMKEHRVGKKHLVMCQLRAELETARKCVDERQLYIYS